MSARVLTAVAMLAFNSSSLEAQYAGLQSPLHKNISGQAAARSLISALPDRDGPVTLRLPVRSRTQGIQL
ncbi:MAG: hypothetical protein OXC69_03165, partial [Candidatus Tectomicrobia bacterium]|nr:hypothetical protein [Candidatus Tectomicrobia bacterium]